VLGLDVAGVAVSVSADSVFTGFILEGYVGRQATVFFLRSSALSLAGHETGLATSFCGTFGITLRLAGLGNHLPGSTDLLITLSVLHGAKGELFGLSRLPLGQSQLSEIEPEPGVVGLNLDCTFQCGFGSTKVTGLRLCLGAGDQRQDSR
jgi:hypothetical protein